jgi:hypothetical protein
MDGYVAADLKGGRRAAELWLGVLLPPLAVLSQLECNYALVLWACRTGREWPLHLVSLLALLVTLFALLLSHRNWRRLGASWEVEGAGAIPRSRYMAVVGLLISLLMSLVIVAQWIPVFIYGPCQR